MIRLCLQLVDNYTLNTRTPETTVGGKSTIIQHLLCPLKQLLRCSFFGHFLEVNNKGIHVL